MNFTAIGVVVPIPTARFGTTSIVTISPFCNPWVEVSAAATFVSTVVITLSISPVIWSNLELKLYNPDPIPVCVPLEWKNNPSLVLPIPTLVVNNPTKFLPLSIM